MVTQVGGVSSEITAEPQGFLGALNRVQSATQSAFGKIDGTLSSLTGPLSVVQARFAAIGALLGGGATFKKAIDETVQYTRESIQLGRALGVGAAVGSTWVAALADIDVTSADVTTATRGLLSNVRENEAAMNAMGLVTRNSAGELRSMDELMLDAIQTVNGYKEGTDRNLAANAIFGKSVSGNSRLLELNSKVIKENAEFQRELGMIIGQDNVDAHAKYDNAIDRANIAMKGIWVTIGTALMPAFTKLAEWFADVAPTAIRVLRGALAPLITLFHGLAFVVQTVVTMITTAVSNLLIAVDTAKQIASNLLSGNLTGAQAAAAQGMERFRENSEAMLASIASNASETRDKIFKLWDFTDHGIGKDKGGEEGGKDFVDTKSDKKGGPGLDALKGWDTYFSELKQRYEQQRQILLENAEQTKRLDLEGIESRKEALRLGTQLLLVTRAEELAQLRQIEIDKFQIERQALEDRLALQRGSALEKQKILNEIELLEREHQNTLQKIDSDSMLERQRNWTGFFRGLDSGFKSVIQGFLQGTRTLGGLVKGLFDTILASVANILAEIAAKWLAQQIMQRILGKVTAAQAITGEAAKAGAGGVASMAAAPFPLNLTAPAFGAAMASAAALYAAAIPAAAKGFDIPAGVNPLTQLHQREMVLPAELADRVRGMTGGEGGGTPIHIHVKSADAKSFARMLNDNNSDLYKAARKAARNASIGRL